MHVGYNFVTLQKYFRVMRLIFILLTALLPLSVIAQNVWEKPDVDEQEQNGTKPNPDAKYLAGAVPEVNGKIEWQLDVDVPGKSAAVIYDTMLKCLTDLTKTENQLEGGRVVLVNKNEHIVAANIREWMVFTDKLFVLDRTEFSYTLIAYCSDSHLKVTMNRISYRYEDENYKAEEWISDGYALNRKKTKIYRGPAKFRRSTIDRKDYLFDVIRQTVLK